MEEHPIDVVNELLIQNKRLGNKQKAVEKLQSFGISKQEIEMAWEQIRQDNNERKSENRANGIISIFAGVILSVLIALIATASSILFYGLGAIGLAMIAFGIVQFLTGIDDDFEI